MYLYFHIYNFLILWLLMLAIICTFSTEGRVEEMHLSKVPRFLVGHTFY